MIIFQTVITPANTTTTNPLLTVIPFFRGFLYKLVVSFPPGSKGLCGLRFIYHEKQIYPVNQGGWFIGDSVKYEFDDSYFFDLPDYVIRVESYNTDEAYEHSVDVGIGVLTKEEYISRFISDKKTEESLQKLIEVIASDKITNKQLLDDLLKDFSSV